MDFWASDCARYKKTIVAFFAEVCKTFHLANIYSEPRQTDLDRCLDKLTKKSKTYHMVQASEHWRALRETKFQERRSFWFRYCGGLQPNRGPVSGLHSFIVSRYHAIVRWLVLKLSNVGCLKETWDRAKNILFLLRHDSWKGHLGENKETKDRMHGYCRVRQQQKQQQQFYI